MSLLCSGRGVILLARRGICECDNSLPFLFFPSSVSLTARWRGKLLMRRHIRNTMADHAEEGRGRRESTCPPDLMCAVCRDGEERTDCNKQKGVRVSERSRGNNSHSVANIRHQDDEAPNAHNTNSLNRGCTYAAGAART